MPNAVSDVHGPVCDYGLATDSCENQSNSGADLGLGDLFRDVPLPRDPKPGVAVADGQKDHYLLTSGPGFQKLRL